MRSFFDRLTTPPASKTDHPMPLSIVCLIAMISGMLMPLALAPYHWWWLAILSPALFYATLHKRNARQGFAIGLSYGFGMWFVGAFWLYTSIHVYGDTPAPLAVLMIVAMAILMGLFSAVQAWAYRRFFPETPLTFAPLWVVFEWLRSWLFTGFPWLFIGYAFTNYGLDEYAPLFGVYAVSFVVVFIAAAFTEILYGKRFWVIPIALFLVGAWGAKHITFVIPKADKPLSVSLLQGNIPQDLKWLAEYKTETLMIYAELSRNEWGRDLVVWPEASIPDFQVDVAPFVELMTQYATSKGTAWVTGIPYWDLEASIQNNPVYYNSIIASGDQASGLYHKQRLVPFGEYIPLAGALYWVAPGVKDDVTLAGFSAGHNKQAPLMIKNHRLAAGICYEMAYPNLTRKNAQNSDFMVTISNDAWFTGTASPWQHLQMVQMRAKENGRWIIRATNTGVTAFINEKGEIVSKLPQDQRKVLRGDLPAMQGQTLYNRLGDWPILGFASLLLLMGIFFKPRVVDTSYKRRR